MKRLFLLGEIGCGKSAMIRTALGNHAARASGFITVRQIANGRVLGFDLLPAHALGTPTQGHRFLELENGPVRHDEVFSTYGTQYLRDAASHPFAVLDEIGGMELLVDDFYAQLCTFLRSDVPCIGVLKTEDSAAALAEKVPMGDAYYQRYRALRRMLETDCNTRLLPLAGWQDLSAAEEIARWVDLYVRR